MLPLDYYSIVPNHSYKIYQPAISFTWIKYATDTTDESIKMTLTNAVADVSFYDATTVGDILYLEFYSTALAGTAPEKFWCIITQKEIVGTDYFIYAKMWKSSNSSHAIQGIISLNDINSGTGGTASANYGINKVNLYQGIFNGIAGIIQSVGEKFTVIENLYAQDLRRTINAAGSVSENQELYNYDVVPNPNT